MSIAAPAHARSENVRGILAMLASMAVFVVNDTLVKVAAASLPTGEAIFVRGLFTAALRACLIFAPRRPGRCRSAIAQDLLRGRPMSAARSSS